ncbi:MAG: PPC domain-containing DNA-binding protein [Candidatus Altarchaeaceae archaeon]
MKYTKTNIGRVFLIKFEHNDDFLEEMKNFVVKENIKAGIFYLIGGIEKAEFAVGPKKIEIPPNPIIMDFYDGREILGIGTIFWNDKPKIHIHAGMGRENNVNLGCIRKNAKVYLTIECVLMELQTNAKKEFDEKIGIDLLNF